MNKNHNEDKKRTYKRSRNVDCTKLEKKILNKEEINRARNKSTINRKNVTANLQNYLSKDSCRRQD